MVESFRIRGAYYFNNACETDDQKKMTDALSESAIDERCDVFSKYICGLNLDVGSKLLQPKEDSVYAYTVMLLMFTWKRLFNDIEATKNVYNKVFRT